MPEPTESLTQPPFPTIETARLFLRALELSDAAELLHHFSDPELLKYLDFEPLEHLEDARGVIGWGQSLFAEGRGILWGLFERQSGRLVGTLNLERKVSPHRAEITYDLAPDWWGQGLMPEAVQAVLPYVFDAMGIVRLETTVHMRNLRSIGVLLKVGFQLEGVLRAYKVFHGELADVFSFSLLAGDWRG
jgi:ribosomal-protein-alanine N-acetyltransferase